MRFKGIAFPPRSSVRYEAELDATQVDFLSLRMEGDIISCELQKVSISVPVGQLPIRFRFPNGWVFVVERSPQMSSWLRDNRRLSLIDKAESNVVAWVLGAIFCIGFVLGSYVYVLPWASYKIAESVPDYAAIALGDKILQSFDQHWEPSSLPHSEQERIQNRVTQYTTKLEPLPYQIDVVFRSSDMGANAFALPGGKIVILDEMIELAESDQQLDSIILHELGHVHNRHMLKKLVHSSVLSVGVSLLTGESSGVVDNLAGIGVFFLSNGHTREAEVEADEYAKQGMRIIHGSSEPMAEMFERFSEQERIDMPVWLSSHPDFKQRIEAARE